MTAELKGIHAKTFQDLDVIKDVLKLDEEQIAKLEKENAELKADNAEWEKASDKWKKVYELTNNQLIKAKEILRSLYFIIQSRIDYKNNIGIADEMWRAEQFFWKEIVLPKESE